MSKHAKGPWEGATNLPATKLWVKDGDGEVVCDLRIPEELTSEARSVVARNCDLIVAAPDLLAALERLAVRRLKDGPCWCYGGPSHDEDCREAREAIAKAKGR